jgi:hypothetical protein
MPSTSSLNELKTNRNQVRSNHVAGTKSKKGYTHIDESEYERIKEILDSGLVTQVKVAKWTGRSQPTLSFIANSDSYQEYRDKASHRNRPKPAPVSVEPTEDTSTATVEVEPSNVPDAVVEDVRALRNAASLERIAVALERLVEAWENTPTKKTGLFG